MRYVDWDSPTWGHNPTHTSPEGAYDGADGPSGD